MLRWHFFVNALISVGLCFPQLSRKCTHLTLIKSLWVSLCCVTAVWHLILWHEDQQRAGQSRRITRIGRNAKSEKRLYENVERHGEVRRTEMEVGRNEKTKERKERSQCGGVKGRCRQQQHWGLHSNDVTSCWHCWTEKQISHLIFALI